MNWAKDLPLGSADEVTRRLVLERAEAISADMGVSLDAMFGRDRHMSIVRARHRLWLAMWRLPMSTPEIGHLLKVNHSSVLLAVRNRLGPDVYKAERVSRRQPRLCAVAS